MTGTMRFGNAYKAEAWRGLLQDVFLLSRAEHRVCTLSSQICRLAHELAQIGSDLDVTGF